MTLFHPHDGQVRVKGVESTTNVVLHAWLKQELTEIVKALPQAATSLSPELTQQMWLDWREGLKVKFTLPSQLPPLRMLLVWDNLAGHQTAELMIWLCEQGILPLYTPLSGSWLNMAESMQRILIRRALDGQNPETPRNYPSVRNSRQGFGISNLRPSNGAVSEQSDGNAQITTTAASFGRFRGLYPIGLALFSCCLEWHCSCQVTH
jgi:hypothetical protein